jgi:hypothetical protein
MFVNKARAYKGGAPERCSSLYSMVGSWPKLQTSD